MKIRQQEKDAQEKPGALSRRGAKAYQGALEAVLSIPIAMGLGYLVDRQFGSGPVFLLVGLALGFGSFVLRLSRLRALIDEVPGDGREPPNKQ